MLTSVTIGAGIAVGALLTRGGLVVTLARAHDMEVRIEASPDGSPGSWVALGTIMPGVTETMFPITGATGTVVRAVAAQPGHQRLESPPVFAVSLARCARRQPDDRRPGCVRTTAKRRSSPTRRWRTGSALTCSASSRQALSQAPRPRGRRRGVS